MLSPHQINAQVALALSLRVSLVPGAWGVPTTGVAMSTAVSIVAHAFTTGTLIAVLL